jgi:hypothetical protein
MRQQHGAAAGVVVVVIGHVHVVGQQQRLRPTATHAALQLLIVWLFLNGRVGAIMVVAHVVLESALHAALEAVRKSNPHCGIPVPVSVQSTWRMFDTAPHPRRNLQEARVSTVT